jgi:pimeloyl-ACP methyl ester carboxylesterase
MPLLDRPGTFISYSAEGHGPSLLLTHGFAATSAMFAGNLPALARRNQVVTWDIRGHGSSGDPDDPACYSAQASTDDMAAILDHLQIGRAVIGGHSLGGYLSLAFALAHPERVSALLLIGTGPGFRSDAARAEWNRVAGQSAGNLEQRGLAGLGAGPELTAGAHRSAAGLARAARGILAQRDSQVIDGLPAITVPTLIVVGADDTRFLAAADYMARKIGDTRLVIIPGAGHAPNISQAEQFDQHARTFLDEISAQSSGADQ